MKNKWRMPHPATMFLLLTIAVVFLSWICDIYGLKAAMDNIAADKDLIKRHARIANATRKAIEAFGLKLHLESGFSDTVTVFDVPEGMTADDILEETLRYLGWKSENSLLGVFHTEL